MPEEAESDFFADDESLIEDNEPIVDLLAKKDTETKEKAPKKKITDAAEGDTAEDAEMKAMLAEFGSDNDDDDSDEEDETEKGDDDDDDLRIVVNSDLDQDVIDHIVLAAGDLEKGVEEFEKKTGVEPKIIGSVRGLGIKCARISFVDASFIEIIAPDPEFPGPIGDKITEEGIEKLTPFHYAIRNADVDDLKKKTKTWNFVPDDITMTGANPDGSPKQWHFLFLYGHRCGGFLPFFVNWDSAEHPCARLPVVGRLLKFSVRAPLGTDVHKLFSNIDVKNVNVEDGEGRLSFQFSTKDKGTVLFSTKDPLGFKFPGFDEDD